MASDENSHVQHEGHIKKSFGSRLLGYDWRQSGEAAALGLYFIESPDLLRESDTRRGRVRRQTQASD
jgi:hypothetical protein